MPCKCYGMVWIILVLSGRWFEYCELCDAQQLIQTYRGTHLLMICQLSGHFYVTTHYLIWPIVKSHWWQFLAEEWIFFSSFNIGLYTLYLAKAMGGGVVPLSRRWHYRKIKHPAFVPPTKGPLNKPFSDHSGRDSEDRMFSHRTNVITPIHLSSDYSPQILDGITVIPHNSAQTMPGKWTIPRQKHLSVFVNECSQLIYEYSRSLV